MVMYNCDTEKLYTQKNNLKNEIINGSNKNYFKVIDLECGTGKTILAEEAFVQMVQTTLSKALFVRERIEDCIKTETRINKMANKVIVKAVNSDTITRKEFNKSLIKELKNYPIIIITHEKYKELSINNKIRKMFCEGRNTLIIDEFLNMSKGNELTISKEFINSFETLLGNRVLRNLYSKLVGELEDYLLLDKEKNTFFNAKSDIKVIERKSNKLKKLIRNNLSKEYCKSIGYTKNELCKKVDEIKNFYKQTCIVEGKIMYCTNLDYQYWKLNNNIILDGSGTLNLAYKLKPDLFIVQRQAKVLDHSKWKFYIMTANSTVNSKNKALNFYEIVNKVIEKLGPDNTLYVGNKSEEKFVNAKHKNHIGNITGSNEYMSLQNIVIGHNPNLPYRSYVLEYIYYSGNTFTNKNSWNGCNVGCKDERVYRFKENQFEEYRQSKNANEIFQAIKRINRNMLQDSKVFIINNDKEIIDRILKMFKNATIEYFDSTIEYDKTKQNFYNEQRKENSYSRKFLSLCKSIKKLELTDLQQQKKNRKGELIWIEGFYSKKKICEFMQISSSNFAKYILNDADVIDYLQRHNIIIRGQAIDFSNTA